MYVFLCGTFDIVAFTYGRTTPKMERVNPIFQLTTGRKLANRPSVFWSLFCT